LESWSYASSGATRRNTAAALAASPLCNNSATDGEISTMNGTSNEADVNTGSSDCKGRKGRKTFDERFKDLMAFKAEFGHCNVPKTRSKKSRNNKYLSLGQWCGDVRQSYITIEQGKIPNQFKLSKADIKLLENAGFEWSRGQKKCTFDERFKDHLMVFKAEFGHCNVPQTRSRNNKYLSLGVWRTHVRQSYKSIKEGGIPKCNKLSKADIQRLENVGFELSRGQKKCTFDERSEDLMAFKAEFGHCNVPQTRSRTNKYYSLRVWRTHVRQSYKSIKEGGIPKYNKLSKADIQRLENVGFEWSLRHNKCTFDEFGHCNVPKTRSRTNKYLSLGVWYNHWRQSYITIKQGGIPNQYKLSKADIKRLENAGFEWSLGHKKCTFDERFKDLMAFKAEFGHCNVPQT